MSNDMRMEPTADTPPAAQASLCGFGLAGWAAVRALAEFSGPDEAVAAQCRRLDEAGRAGDLHTFLAGYPGRGAYPRTFPEYLATEDDLWALARHALETFVETGMAGLFLGDYSGGRPARAYRKYEEWTALLGGNAAREIAADLDCRYTREQGDAWQVFKFWVSIPGAAPADLDAIERYARGTPEEQWGGCEATGLTPDLEAVLRAALEAKRSGRPPEPPPVWDDAWTEDEDFLRELELLDGGGEVLGR